MTTMDCSAGFEALVVFHSLNSSFCCLSFSHQYISYLMLLYLMYALNNDTMYVHVHVPGSMHLNNMHLINDMRLTTGVYGTTDVPSQALECDKTFYGYTKHPPNEQPVEHLDCLFRTTASYNFITESTIKNRATSDPFYTVCS